MTQDIAELPEVAQVPNKIRADTSNVDVQLFILNQLLKYDHNLNKPTAWDLVKNFTGDGEGIFALPQEQWMAAFGDRHGIMLYHKILQEKRHSEQDVITDQDTIWPYLRYFGAVLTMANAGTALFEGIKFHKLEVTKPIAITNATYGALCGFIFILISSKKLGTARRIPNFFKVKPRVEGKEVFWWPGTGNAR